MAKPEWGAKRICYNCGARYYDMRREPPVCPKCGTQFDPEAFLKSRRGRAVPADAAAKAAAVKKRPVVDDDVGVEADEAEVDADIEAADTDETETADDAEELAGDDDVDSVIEDTDDLDDSGLDDVAPNDDDDDR